MSPVGTDVEKDVQVHKRKIQVVGRVRHLFYVSPQLHLFLRNFEFQCYAILMVTLLRIMILEKQSGQRRLCRSQIFATGLSLQ